MVNVYFFHYLDLFIPLKCLRMKRGGISEVIEIVIQEKITKLRLGFNELKGMKGEMGLEIFDKINGIMEMGSKIKKLLILGVVNFSFSVRDTIYMNRTIIPEIKIIMIIRLIQQFFVDIKKRDELERQNSIIKIRVII